MEHFYSLVAIANISRPIMVRKARTRWKWNMDMIKDMIKDESKTWMKSGYE